MSDNNIKQVAIPIKAEAIAKEVLEKFDPISKLSPSRLDELSEVCIVEHVSKDLDPTRMSTLEMQAMYVVRGDLGIRYENGRKIILRGGSEASKYPVDSERLKIRDTIALTPIDIVRIDLDLLDIMLTWDQLSGYIPPGGKVRAVVKPNEVKMDAAKFSAFKLNNGVFRKLPAANIESMFARLTSVDVEAGQTIVTQGQEGDYYYLIQKGTAVVTRVKDPSQLPVELAEISAGAAFGEEALASDTKRNATVTMKTDGQLLRLNKQDFIELLKAPIVRAVNMDEALKLVAKGAAWLDVRFETEYKYHHLDGAVNSPLHELRSNIDWLDKDKEYIAYCQTGRRSSAAAFILAQFGINAVVLENGTRAKLAH
jgi:rhodanese-related sulfurtransferase